MNIDSISKIILFIEAIAIIYFSQQLIYLQIHTIKEILSRPLKISWLEIISGIIAGVLFFSAITI